ncbi:MAG TPA: iron ABC transporter permease [Candidatus Bathyarchaeota archaeon]|nr:iron ABC transporter permease [Candidatus Bathyarchaeota archaeon]
MSKTSKISAIALDRILGKLSTIHSLVKGFYLSSILFFLAIILLPAILGILTRVDTLSELSENPQLFDRAINAIIASFALASFVSLLDLVTGIPLAWLIVKKGGRLVMILDAIVDLPMIIPTVTLGFSVLLFWSESNPFTSLGFSGISPGWLTVLLLHYTFSYPVVVRVLVGKLMEIDETYEIAGRTLGGKPLTVARTINIPLAKIGIITAYLLAFARSLSETGATMMVAGLFENGPIFIKRALSEGWESPLVFTSLTLISVAVIIFFLLRSLGPRVRIPFRRANPNFEGLLSKDSFCLFRDSISLLILTIFIVIPSIYLSLITLPNAINSGLILDVFQFRGVWGEYWNSLLISYVIGFIVTGINTVFSLPMAILIAREKFGSQISKILDVLSNVSIMIPSVALGVSIRFFWGGFTGLPEFWLIVMSHLCITYPYMVSTMVSAIRDIPKELEESARTLGSDPYTSFRKVTLPLAKYSFLSGMILTLARSVDETGATLAVSKTVKTVPIIIVDWVKDESLRIYAGLGATFLLLFSLIILLLLRKLVGRGKYA